MTDRYSTGTIGRMDTERAMGHSLPPRGERTNALVDHFRARIEAGVIRPGARLPSVRQVATDWGVSRFTAVEAYDRLVAAGWAEARRGSGFFALVPRLQGSQTSATVVRPSPEGPSTSWLLRALLRTNSIEASPGMGLLPASWLDSGLVSRALRTAAGESDTTLGYGDPQGLPTLRRALARKLTEIGLPEAPEAIITTIGATQALDLIASALVRPGDVVLVDDPGYFLPFAQFAARGAHVVGVPWEADGPNLEALDELLTRHRPRLYLTTASLHNPTGGALAPAKAFRLLKLAEATGTWVVEDDVYGDLAMHPPPRLGALDGLSRVIYVNSFSKTMAPGWRVGFLAAPSAILPQLLEAKLLSGITTPQPAEAALASILSDGAYRRHIARLRERVARARARGLKAVASAGFTLMEPAGEGIYLWAKGEVDSQVLAARLWEDGIIAAPGSLFSPSGAPTPWTRINVAAAEHPPLLAAMRAANRPV